MSKQMANDSVCKLVQNGDLAKSLNTVRTVPGAPNPFVAASRPAGNTNGGNQSGSGNTSSGTAQSSRK